MHQAATIRPKHNTKALPRPYQIVIIDEVRQPSPREGKELRAVNEDITSERHESPPAQSLAGCALSTNDFVVLLYWFMVLSCFVFLCCVCLLCAHICWPGVLVVRCAINKELKTLRGRSRLPFRPARAKNASARCHTKTTKSSGQRE